MANISLADFPAFINQQIESRQRLSNQLEKAEALSNVAVNGEFIDNSGAIIHSYLLALRDIIESAKAVNEKDISDLLKKLPLYDATN